MNSDSGFAYRPRLPRREILDDYPYLEKDDFKAVFTYARR